MRYAIALLLSLLVGLVSLSPAQEPQPIPVVLLAPQKTDKPMRALQFRLLPDPSDQLPGNAAPFWMRAALAVRSVRTPLTEAQHKWLSPSDTPLKDFPRKEARELLKKFEMTLLLAEEASRRERCDWQMPPLTLQTLTQLPLDEIQGFRELAVLLSLRFRLELAEGNDEKALAPLQIGLTLAHHLGQGDTLIHNLVGIAIAAIMLGRVEEIIQTPNSPNLYWTLTALPRPVVDIRHAVGMELNSWYRSFPQLRQATQKPMSVEEINRLADDITRSLASIGGDLPAWSSRAALAATTIKLYPDARQYLLDHGRKRAEVEALPTLQVVVIYMVAQYDAIKDDYLKWLSLPSWQMWQELKQNERALTERARRDNPMIALLLPALSKVAQAQLRLDQQIAGLRGAEALRLYAAEHKGQPPEKWPDIKEVPLPIDPFTGQGFEANYRLRDGKAVLEIMPLLNIGQLGRRYVLESPKEK